MLFPQQFQITSLVPSSPQKVKVANIGPTSVFVTWLPPKNPNGVIRGYHLRLRSLESSDENDDIDDADVVTYLDFHKSNSEFMKKIDVGNVTEKLLDQLRTGSPYSVALVAYTVKGDGEPSKEKRFKTLQQGAIICICIWIYSTFWVPYPNRIWRKFIISLSLNFFYINSNIIYKLIYYYLDL